MIGLIRRLGVTCVALSLAVYSVPPAPASALENAGAGDAVRAISLLNYGCASPATLVRQVAQATASPQPSGSPSPAAGDASPSPVPTISPLIGKPVAPSGPQILVPPPLPTPAGSTPPPLPSTSPSPSSSPGPIIISPETAPPSSSPIPAPTYSSGPLVTPSPSPSASPEAGEVLQPGQYAILGDKLTGRDVPGEPKDLDGHVNIFYQDGVIGGDHAHYDGTRYIDLTGHTFVKNRSGDTTLFADSIRFDTKVQKAVLINGRGESTQGVEQGKLHFSGRQMTTTRDGVTHVERANLTTCENARGGYHVESKTLDIYPGDKAVARSAVLFLGALAILYLPVVVISLRHDELGSRRNPGFLPLIGYSAAEGFYIKARIGFSPSDTYYGYYRVEAYTKIGFGLGYVGTLKRKDGRRQTDVDYFRLKNNIGPSNSNFHLTDQEVFSPHVRGQFAFNYTGNFGPLVSLPPQYDISAAVDSGTDRGDHDNYSFRRTATGGQSQQNDYAITDHRAFSPRLTNDTVLSLTTSTYNFGFSSNSSTLHYSTLTHYSTNAYDFNFTIDKFNAHTSTGNGSSQVQKEPELQIRPHNPLFPRLRGIPINADFTLGLYSDPVAPAISTSRGQANFTVGPVLAHVAGSDFSATMTLVQDAYGTGDLKAQIGQQAQLTTPLFGHILNTISYNESHVNGPLAEPFKSIDVLGNGLKQANDILRIYNRDTYSLELTATTYFNRQAQAIGYRITSRPSPRSTVMLGGSFQPGSGAGFGTTSVQVATPFGYRSDLQFSTFVDWKAHGRLTSKNIFYRHVVGDCYELRLSYNQDLKQVTGSVVLLAFPSQAANFGIGQSPSLSSIIPQNFSLPGYR